MHLLHYNSAPWRPFFNFVLWILWTYLWICLTEFNQTSNKWLMERGSQHQLTSKPVGQQQHLLVAILFHTLTFSAIYTKQFDGIQRNFTWMIDGRRHVQQMIFENACLQQRHLMAILYFISAILKFVNNFKAVWQNSMKLHTSDQWWEMSTPADFTTCSPLVVPPIGHFFILDF